MIPVPRASRVNKLPVPCLLSLLLPPGLPSGRILLQVKSEQDGKGWPWFSSELWHASSAKSSRITLPKAPGMETWSQTVKDSALIQLRLSLQQLQSHKAVPSPCQAPPQATHVFTTAGAFGISKRLHGKTPWGMEPTTELLCLLSAPSCHIILPRLFLVTSG